MNAAVHLSYRLGGCATAAATDAVTKAQDSDRVNCPICRRALRKEGAR